MHGYQSIENRFDQLNLNNQKNNIISKNEHLTYVVDKYCDHFGGREINKITLLCKYIEEINFMK